MQKTSNNVENLGILKQKIFEFKRLINKIIIKNDYRKETLIEVCAIIFSYYLYQEYILEEDFTESILDLYNRAVFAIWL